MRQDVVRGMVAEMVFQIDNNNLLEQLAAEKSRRVGGGRMPVDYSLLIPRGLSKGQAIMDSAQNSCDMGDWRGGRGFDSLASKTFNQCSEDAFVEVAASD